MTTRKSDERRSSPRRLIAVSPVSAGEGADFTCDFVLVCLSRGRRSFVLVPSIALYFRSTINRFNRIGRWRSAAEQADRAQRNADRYLVFPYEAEARCETRLFKQPRAFTYW